MVSAKELARLQARKELLVAQCDLQRGILYLECTRLRESLNWVGRSAGWMQRVLPWLPLAAPVAGFLVARRWKTLIGYAGKAFGWRMLWRVFRR
jgi:hypothetical protein